MGSCYLRVEGMQWKEAREFVRSLLLQNNAEVNDVKVRGSVARISYEGEPAINDWIGQINGSGVLFTKRGLVTRHDPVATGALELACIAAAVVAAYSAMVGVLGFDPVAAVPRIDGSLTYGALFVTGILCSLHCLGMCGALNLASTFGEFRTPIRGAGLYNAGRISSYVMTGALAGALGSVLSIGQTAAGAILCAASLLMLVISLNLMGIIHIPVLTRVHNPTRAGRSALAIGLLNGLMPCGMLQSMQLYALSTGSPAVGALSMLAFGLGTLPAMFGIGLTAGALKGKGRQVITKLAAGMVFVLALAMLGRGLVSLGVSLPTAASSATEGYAVASVHDGVQTVSTTLAQKSYGDVAVYEGVPVEIHIHADASELTSCNETVRIEAFGVERHLEPGDNVIEFTPGEPGDYTMTCWMGMITNTVRVMGR